MGRGRGTQGLGDAETWDAGTREHAWVRKDPETRGRGTPEFCAEFSIYNFWWSRETYYMMESLPVADDFQRP